MFSRLICFLFCFDLIQESIFRSDSWFHRFFSSIFGDTARWWMVDAMFFSFVFVILIVQAKFSFPSIINDCSFSRDIYSSNSAFNGQFSFLNQTYIVLRAPFAFNSPNQNSTAFQLGSVYQFRNANFLIPFPIILNCSQRVRRCQLKTIAVTNFVIRDSEPIPASLNPFNYTNGTMSSTTTTTMNSIFTQMGLYLKQGRYQLNNCTLNDGFDQTDPLQIFSIDIQYEKSIGKSLLFIDSNH